MKLVTSLLFLFTFTLAQAECRLDSKQTVLSLSGPVTHLLYHLKLLNKVKAISLFHGITEKDFSGDRIGGGIFLSPDYLKKFQKPLIFFDESQEMRKNFSHENAELVEVKTRNMDPFQAFQTSLNALRPWLIDCEKPVKELQTKVDDIQKTMLKKQPLKKTFVFYLGEILSSGRRPNLVMVDNLVLFFKNHKLIKSYPTELNYASWSEKVLGDLKKSGMVEIGLINSGFEDIRVNKVGEGQVNFVHRSLLIPGLAQIYLLEAFWRELEIQDS